MSGLVPKNKYVRILSIDGGGIRGIIPGQILVALEEKLRERSGNPESRLADYFDLIAGTGTGGILACAYLSPVKPGSTIHRFTASQVTDIYLRYGGKVFDNTLDHRILSMGGFLDEKYHSNGLEQVLSDYFNDLQLSHLLKPCLITAYDVTKRKAHFFTQHNADKPSLDFYVRDIARATSASPTFFECKRVLSLSGVSYPLIDGGVFANNPALCALAEATKVYAHDVHGKQKLSLSDVVIVSLGTGLPKQKYEYDDAKDWGLSGWSRPLLDFTNAGVSETVDYQLKQLYTMAGASNQYLRINPELSVDVSADMDNVSADNLRMLKELGLYTAEEFDIQLESIVELILQKKD